MNSSFYGSAFLFLTPEAKEPIEKWNFSHYLKTSRENQLDYFYKECGFNNHYMNHGLRYVRINVQIIDRSPTALLLSKNGKRLSIDTEEQWQIAKTKIETGVGELLVYIYGSCNGAHATKSNVGPVKMGKKKRDMNVFYEKRNRRYDEDRDGVISINDNDREVDNKLNDFIKKVEEKYPKAVVVNSSRIKCGLCGEIKTLSVPFGIRNFERHINSKHQTSTANKDKKQRSIIGFTRMVEN